MSKYDIGRKEKQSKLIEYLLKITQATRKAILYIPTDYGEENILWFSDLVDTNCTLKDWSNTDDELLKVRRKQEPVKPSIPEICVQWIVEEDDDSKPQLRDNIFEESKFEKFERKLLNYPQVKLNFDKYLKQWGEWKSQHDKWKKEEKYYQKLFAIRQALNKNKEQYELILGLGLLQYKNKDGNTITRHLLVSKNRN